MTKRSKRRQSQQDKDQAGCMWGLISIFDFRHVRTTRRLLSDTSLMTRSIVASADPTSQANMLTSSEERHVSIENCGETEKPTLDVVKTSVKELMEEELVIEQASAKETIDDEVELFNSDHGSHAKNHKHTEKTSNKSFDTHQTSSQKASQYTDLEALMEEILLIYQRRNQRQLDLDVGQNHTFSVFEEKLNAAFEVFMNENLSDEKSRLSKDFIDTFQMLNSNRELFSKLLQDQNSLLLNHTQDVNDQKSKSMGRSSSLETEPSNRRLDAPVGRKHRNFFRRRSKSHDDSPPRIVLLKPNSLENKLKMDNDVHSERISSHFSFMEIKKRLKNAMGKEQVQAECIEKTNVEGSSGWSSPNRDHFYTERFAKKEERMSKLREPETEQMEKEEHGESRGDISSIYTEAKKHLSEMLCSGDEDAGLTMERLPRTLGKILSFEENDDAQIKLMENESAPSMDVEEKSDVGDEVDNDIAAGEVEKTENQEQVEVEVESIEHSEISDEERSPHCLKLEESSSPKTEDTTGRPSPVSVLDPLFSDTEISPASSVSRPVEAAIQPLCIRFEDEEICTRNCTENEESAFEYVEAVLLASDLNWDEFENRWLSSMQILDSSLFDEVEIFSSQPSHDQRLFFDSTNEILKEVCDCYLNFFLHLSFIKRNIQPIPEGVDLINEVWERIQLHLNNNYPLSLDHIVKKDLGISKTWMDLHSNSQEILFEIHELIFQDMMDDTLFTLANDFIDNEK